MKAVSAADEVFRTLGYLSDIDPADMKRDGAAVARNPHKVEIMGSNPIPASRGERALSLQSDPINGKRSVTHRNRR